MEVEKIIEKKENLIEFLKEKGFEEEKDYYDEEYKEGTYFKISKRKLLVVYEIVNEDKLKEIKDHFLIDRGLSYCIIVFNHKLIFYRNFGETKHFIYSERTKNNVSKKDKLENIKDFDSLFQSKDISAQFYEGFKLKRNLLVQHIKNDIPPTQKYLIAQKIFDRFFFIYFLCHKGIIKFEDGGKISGENLFSRILLREKDFLKNLKRLFHLFNSQEKNIFEIKDYKIVIPYLNGGLFRPDVLEQDLDISLKNKEWETIFDFLNSYHWIIEDIKASEENEDKILTPEILGHVYERSVVEWEQIGFEEEAEKVVKKVTERKKKGVYYTPESITDYISNNTIIPYLLDKLNNKYKSFEDLIGSRNKKDYKKAIEILNEIKVLDPACGSGAFLIKASEVIYFLKRRLLHELGEKPNFYSLKLDLITKNIYGVDILSGAIEISKLRLWLWLISDFDTDSDVEPLPNIEYNLMNGNSLIGFDSYKGKLVEISKNLIEKTKRFEELKSEYKKSHGKISEILRDLLIKEMNEVRKELNKLYIQDLNSRGINLIKIKKETQYNFFGEKTKSKKEQNIMYLEDFENKLKPFHWVLEFSEVMKKGGFDVIISNPPYIKEYNNRTAFDGIRWSEYYQGKMDIWYFFACRGIDLLKGNEGYLSFIAQNNWVTSYGASRMRNKVIKDIKIIQLLDFGDFKVFKDAGIQTMIMIFKSDKNTDNYRIDYRRLNYTKEVTFDDVIDLLNKMENKNIEYLSPKISRKELIDRPITFSNKFVELILNKIQSKSNFKLDEKEATNGIHHHHDIVNKKRQQKLGNNFEVGQGIFVLNNEELKQLNLTKKEVELIKPQYTTKELFKYYADKKNREWVIYTDSSFKDPKKINQYPNIKKHLDKFKAVITSDNKPYGLHRARDERFFKGEKIIGVRKCTEPTFTYTDFDCYVSATFYVIKTDRINLKFLTALFNSKLIAFWLKHKGKMQGNNYQIDKEPLLNIPILKPLESQQKPFIDLVNQILSITKSKDYLQNKQKQAKVKELQDKIDKLVYKLYDLTEDEIKIVEGLK